MDTGADLEYRFAAPRDLRAVLAAYWECFDATQRMRTVAHAPFLFRFFHKREMRAGRCRVAVASSGADVAGFCIVRQVHEASGAPWLLSAIGVVPKHRAGGVARRLFDMVAAVPLTLTVEESGPVSFYEKAGMRRTGERTLVYFGKRNVADLERLAGTPAVPGAPFSLRALHWSGFLLETESVSREAVAAARRRLRFQKNGVLELPARLDVPQGVFDTVVHEFAFAKP